MEKMDISVIIPAYNEENRIVGTLDEIHAYFLSTGKRFEMLVVDDGSNDNTAQLIHVFAKKHSGVRVIKHKVNMGKGAAVRTGVNASFGKLVLFSDSDLSTPIGEEFLLREAIEKEGFDAAIGSRGLKDSVILTSQPFFRRMMGKIFPFLVRLIVMKNFRDTQCGFKMFRSEAAKEIFPKLFTEGFAFDVEILYRALKNNFKVKEVPVKWKDSPGSKVNILRDPFRMFAALLKIKMRVG